MSSLGVWENRDSGGPLRGFKCWQQRVQTAWEHAVIVPCALRSASVDCQRESCPLRGAVGRVRGGHFGRHFGQSLAHSNRVSDKQKLKIKYGKGLFPHEGGQGTGSRRGTLGISTVIASWEHEFHYTAILYALHV